MYFNDLVAPHNPPLHMTLHPDPGLYFLVLKAELKRTVCAGPAGLRGSPNHAESLAVVDCRL